MVGAVLAALLALSAPLTAAAKGPSESREAEAPPGITVTGIGFGPATGEALERAVRDARQRATLIAGPLGLELGAVEGIELPALTQFGTPGSRPIAVAATVNFAIVGGAGGEEGGRWVKAHGVASARVTPLNRTRSRAIKRAILSTRRTATPQAAAAASRSAKRAAAAAGVGLGAVVSVSEAPSGYYFGPSFYDPALGSFGPGRFCGIVRRPILRRDPETGLTEVVRRVPHRRCFAPSTYSVDLEIRYEAG
jgi:hypothetical protein